MDNIQQNIIWISFRVKNFGDKNMLLDIPFHELEELIVNFAEKFESIHFNEEEEDLLIDYPNEIYSFTDKELARELWDRFGDVPMNPETEKIECDWNGFEKGTHREEIWHWFEETFGVSVAEDLMHV